MDCTQCRCELRQVKNEEVPGGGSVRVWVCANPRCPALGRQITTAEESAAKTESAPGR